MTTQVVSVWEAAARLIGRESHLLDTKDWDAWLDLYTKNCEYWIPAWRSDGTLVTDPKTEISLIYYANRAGLEARVFRVRSGRSAASTPTPRTTHVAQLVDVTETGPGELRVRSNWTTSSALDGQVATHFGYADYSLAEIEGSLKIRAKKTVIVNDVIREVLDFFSV